MWRFLRLAALAPWALLPMLIVGGVALAPSMAVINVVIGTVLAGAAGLLGWRALALDRVARLSADYDEVRRLMRAEAAIDGAVMIVGLILLVGASSRVFGEGAPVFG